MDWKKVKQARQRLSREQGTLVKDWGGRTPFVLIYPNTYYLGMSNLGLHTVYHLLNRHQEIVCERAFWEKEDRDRQSPPISLESQRPLTDFAVIAFSITFELDYLNIVPLLKASGIPLYAAERDERHPLIIAGGPVITTNPRPLAPFFDCLCIGEAEPIIPTLLPVLSDGITGKRADLLQKLSALPGIYVPEYHSGTAVVRQWARNLDDFPVTSVILTPDTELGGLYLIEVERGCKWSCRFCLVSSCFRPVRFHSLDQLIEQAERGLKYRKRIGLVGPAVTDHPRIEELVTRLRQMGAEISISSLRVSPLSSKVLEAVVQSGARTIALAPEAGSQRLRQVINKGITETDILEAIGKVAEQGVKQLKLYFMIGLPSETDDDIEAIIKLTLRCKDILDRRQRGGRITLNVAPFVPKAGTPFQWQPMASIQTLNHRLSRLQNSLPPKGIKLKWESPAWSQVQAVLARGDVSLAEVLVNMKRVSLSGWRRAVAECHLDIDFYAHQSWPTGQKLPWAVLESGIKPTRLESEHNKALT